jgi:hypothetical protein
MKLWRELLEVAVHCPSPHNVQPWRVRIVSETEAELSIEKRRTLPKEDVTGSFIILTMGMFIEALKILAANRHFELTYELLSEPSMYTPKHIEAAKGELLPFARLRLMQSTSAHPDYDDSLFLKRRTSRIELLPTKVPGDAARALTELARKWNQSYEQCTDPATIEWIMERNTEALFEDLNAPQYHDEIVEWFRFTDRSSRKKRDGLDYRCMNTSRAAFWTTGRLPFLLRLPVTSALLARIYRRQLGLIPTLGVLSGAFWAPEAAIETGRFLVRFWLETARHSLYIHPFGNLVTNRRAAARCQEKLGVENIWLVFKVGFSKEPPKSYRRSVEEVLVA